MRCPSCHADITGSQPNCPNCGRRLSLTMHGYAERRLVTVLFADISGFTAISEVLDPEEVREIVNACLEDLVGVIHRYGGTVDKFIGDAVMAIFGAPRAHEDDAERAVAAALEMRRALDAVVQRMGARLPSPLALHVGVSTGPVVAGQVGALARSDYTVLGDTVNVAARLEDISEGGQILVTERTERSTRHAFMFNRLPPVALKGKREPVPVFELLRARKRSRGRRGLPGMLAPLVGREMEREALAGALDALKDGYGGLVTVTGPAGTGKSRMLREARALATERALRWLEASTGGVGGGGMLALWADVAVTLEAAEAESGTLPTTTSSNSISLRGTTARLSLANTLRDLLEREARRSPLVLALDDLHAADRASLSLLYSVAELSGRVPVLLLAAFRSDATTLADLPSRAVLSIELGPLDPVESATLARVLVGADDRLAPVRELLVERAEGNPLFLEELLRALAEQGALAYRQGAWQLTGESVEVMLPASLQSLLLDRIDRLPEEEKRLLQVAAVVGRDAPSALLEMIVGEGTTERIAALVEAGLLLPREEGVSFHQALLQEAAYASLLIRHRRTYHRRIAEVLEATPEMWTPEDELPVVLAHHWERAELWPQAANTALTAALKAMKMSAHADAFTLASRALASAEKASDAVLLRTALTTTADAALAAGLPEQALDALERALTPPPEPLERAALERQRGAVFVHLGMITGALDAFDRAGDALTEAEALAGPETVREEAAAVSAGIASAYLARHDDDRARVAAERARRLHPGGPGSGDALLLLATLELRAGDTAAARARAGEALAVAEDGGDTARAAAAYERLSEVGSAAGDLAEASQALQASLAGYESLDDARGVARCCFALAERARHDGKLADALTLYRRAVESAVRVEDANLAARSRLRLGRVLGQRGEWREAMALLAAAGADDAELAGEAELESALTDVARGGAPVEALEAALDAAGPTGGREPAQRARLGLATIARRAGRLVEARDRLRAVLEHEPGGQSESAIAALAGLAQISLAEEHASAAVQVGGRALEAAERCGPRPVRWYAGRVHALSLAAAGRSEEAEQLLLSVIAETRPAGALPELAAALSAWVRIRRQSGDGNSASQAMSELAAVASTLSANR